MINIGQSIELSTGFKVSLINVGADTTGSYAVLKIVRTKDNIDAGNPTVYVGRNFENIFNTEKIACINIKAVDITAKTASVEAVSGGCSTSRSTGAVTLSQKIVYKVGFSF